MEAYGYIYLTTNLINNKRYVGQHSKPKFNRKYKGSGFIITRAFKKHKKKNFKVQLLQYSHKLNGIAPLYPKLTKSQLVLNALEIFWIKKLKTHTTQNGYNVDWGGHGQGVMSESTKSKISSKQKGVPEKYPVWNKGKKSHPSAIKSLKDTYSNMTKKEKEQRSENIKASLRNKNQKEINKWKANISKTKQNKSQEDFNLWKRRISNTKQNKSQEEKNIIGLKIKQSLAKKTAKQKTTTIEKAKQTRTATLAKRTDEEWADIGDNISKSLKGKPKSKKHVENARIGFLNFLNDMSDKEKEEFFQKRSAKKHNTEAARSKKESEIINSRIRNALLSKNSMECQYCQKPIKEQVLNRHEKDCIENPNKVWYECPDCNYIGRRQQDLNTHIKRLHPKATP